MPMNRIRDQQHMRPTAMQFNPNMASENPAAEEDRRQKLREAGRRKLEEFKKRQLMEMHPDRSAFGNMLVMSRTVPAHAPEVAEATSRMVGIPMRQQRNWSASLQPYRITLRPPPEQLSQTCRPPISASHQSAGGHTSASSITPASRKQAASMATRKDPGSLPQRRSSNKQIAGATLASESGQAEASDQLPRPVRTQAIARNSAAWEATDPAVSPGRDSEMVSMLLQQVSQLQADKQKLQLSVATLEQENANLQELVGFLTDESGAMTEQDGDPHGPLVTRQHSGSDYDLAVEEGDLDEQYTVMQQEHDEEPMQTMTQEPPANIAERHESHRAKQNQMLGPANLAGVKTYQ